MTRTFYSILITFSLLSILWLCTIQVMTNSIYISTNGAFNNFTLIVLGLIIRSALYVLKIKYLIHYKYLFVALTFTLLMVLETIMTYYSYQAIVNKILHRAIWWNLYYSQMILTLIYGFSLVFSKSKEKRILFILGIVVSIIAVTYLIAFYFRLVSVYQILNYSTTFIGIFWILQFRKEYRSISAETHKILDGQ